MPLPVSQDFHEKMKAQTRRIHAKIQVHYTDPFIDQSIQVFTSENANYSYPEQVSDNIEEPHGKIASLDGSWILDGTYVLAPSPEEAEDLQMGWWGSQLSDENGNYTAPYPTLSITFAPRPIHRLQVIADNKRKEWPVNFEINLYSNETLLYTETVTDNTEIFWSTDIERVNEVTKMELIITKWSHANRQVKILEFFTSIQETYKTDDILLINLLEEREVSQGSLPVGNISSNEIDIRLVNENGRFDAGNRQSPLYQLLKPNRRIKAWLGTEDELIPLGTFWSGDWTAPEGEIYVQTTGRDRLELLSQSTFSSSPVYQNKTLYDLAKIVLEDAGIKEEEYWIDTELQEFLIPYAYFEPVSHREALRKIAEACLGQCYCDRNGLIRLEGYSYLQSKTEPDIVITRDDYFAKDNPYNYMQIANYIEVETRPLRPAPTEEVYRSSEPVSINAGETISITAYYNVEPCIEAVASVEGVGSIADVTYYSWGADVKVTSSTAGEFELVINAKPLKVQGAEKVVAKDDDSIREHGRIKYTFPKNSLVQTRQQAQKIADSLLAYYKEPRRDLSLDWRGNPALLLGDRVRIIDEYGGEDFFITMQNIEYDGGLRVQMEGRKVE